MESVKYDKTKKEREAEKQKNIEVADKYAKSKGKELINDITNEAVSLYNNPETTQLGKAAMQEVIKDLVPLILYQEIYESSLPASYDFEAKIRDNEMIRNGNGKEFVVDLLTGIETYSRNKFIPDEQTYKDVEAYLIQMYDESKELSPQGYQFQKDLTLTPQEYIPYFLSGKLEEYMSKLRSQLRKAYKIFIADKLFTKLTTITPQKIIDGTSENMFDCFVKEIFPAIEDMQLLNSGYNYRETNFIDTSNLEDIYIIMSAKNKSMMKTGIASQLFNAQLFNVEGKISDDHILVLGNKMTIGDSKTVIKDSGTPWVDDNTIWVFDVSKIKSVLQIDEISSQNFAKNMTTLISMHIWGALDILPWCKCFKYTNANLSKIPQ